MDEQSNQIDYSKQLLNLFETEPFVWGNLYFPNHFTLETPSFHLTILDELRKHKFFAVAAPRSSSKTTLILFLLPIHWITFKKKHCIVMVGNTYKKAASQLETIKKEFRENQKLRDDFGVVITKDAEGSSTFRHPDGFECHIVCKGSEQLGSIRGEKFGAYRPDAILADDMEEDEEVRNPERRENIRQLYDDALIPSLDINSDFNVCVLGTILHDDSLIARLISDNKYPQYRKLGYRALNTDKDGNEYSLWPEKWSLKWLREQRELNPSSFAREFQNDPVSDKEARFDKKQFRYWEIDNGEFVLFGETGNVVDRGSLISCKASIGCDLAWSEKREADSTVILPALITPRGDILVEKYVAEKGMRPDKFAEYIFTMEQRLRLLTGSAVPVGFEKAMLEKVTQWILKSEMRKRNRWLITKDLKFETDKVTRIETVLQPRYANSIIYHRKTGMGDLEYQLIRFPSGTHDDIIDALQMAIRLLEYPKGYVKQKDAEDDFMRIRKTAIDAKIPATVVRHHNFGAIHNSRKAFVFGRRKKTELPYTKAII